MKKRFVAVIVLVIISVCVGYFFLVKHDAGYAPGWSTYTNEAYGYQISYPHYIVKVNNSSNTHKGELTPLLATNPISVLLDAKEDSDEISTIMISVILENQAVVKINNLNELKTYYQTEVIPYWITQAKNLSQNLSESDFTFKERDFNGYQAIQVSSPIETAILIINGNNEGIIVSLPHSDDSTNQSPNKTKNSELVLATFKLTK